MSNLWGVYAAKRTSVQFSTTDLAKAATYKCTAAYNNSLLRQLIITAYNKWLNAGMLLKFRLNLMLKKGVSTWNMYN